MFHTHRLQWCLFYVDSADVIQNVYSENDSTTWYKGRIGEQGYRVANSTTLIFAAARGKQYNQTLSDLDGGMGLYAGGTDGILHEYIYDEQDGSWSAGFTFPNTNGLGGASTWFTGSEAFLYVGGNDGTLELWYRDYNNTSTNQNNKWQLGPSSNASLFSNGSMCGQYGIAYQDSEGLIQGSNFSHLEDVSQTRWDVTFDITTHEAIPGSAVSYGYFFSYPKAHRNLMNQIFYQPKDHGIEEAVRTWAPDNATMPGIWEYNPLPI